MPLPSLNDTSSAQLPPNGPASGAKSLYSSYGKLGKAVYIVGAVATAYDFYNSISKAKELNRKLKKLKDASELVRYEGAAKEVYNIAMDLQIILDTVFKDNDQ